MKKIYYPINCPVCKSVFQPKTTTNGCTKTCSVKCAAVLRKGKVSPMKGKKGKTAWNKGVPMSEEGKKHLRDINLGKKQSEETKKKIGKIHKGNKYCLGKKLSAEHKLKIGEAHHKRYDIIGRKEYKRYIHTTGTVEYKRWRTAVFNRDNYICQGCGQIGYVEAHHIKSWAEYKELRYKVKNGVTLCRECHKKERS